MTLICEWCGRSFERTNVYGPIPKYCTPSHRQRAYEARKDMRTISIPIDLAYRLATTDPCDDLNCGDAECQLYWYIDGWEHANDE